jgi:hypothetical protein
LYETRTWLAKAAKRNLIPEDTHAAFNRDINQVGRMLNAYIKSIGTGPQAVREVGPEWNEEGQDGQ